jgi:putative tryptophan/tyrosine transport system substrate-binding protein
MPHRNTHAAAVDHRDGNPGGCTDTPENSRTCSVTRRDALAAMISLGAVVPLGACEQRTGRTEHTGQTRRVGLLLGGVTEEAVARQRRVIVERLERHGFVEGKNLRIEVRRAGHSPAEDDGAIRPLVASQPDAILVDTSTLTTRTRAATDTIPIVFTGVGDPIGSGLINDFARPGGNTTGVHYSQLEIGAKRLELLRDLLPQARRVMVVRYLAGGELDVLPHLRNTASRLGFEIVEIAGSWAGFDPPPASSVYGKPDAIYNGERWIFNGAEHVVDQIIRFAAEQRIPSLFWEAEAAERGATLAYGVNLTRELGRATDQLARVLKGAKPGELPVDSATEYELVVNKKAAAALGIAIPASILVRANRVIE